MLSIAQKASELGVSIVTLRRWHQKGLLNPDFITPGGHRRYNKKQIEKNRIVVGYSRVSSHDQREDLQRQSSVLQQSGVNKVISDIGSSLNFNKKGFSSLINLLFSGSVSEIKIIEKDHGFALVSLFSKSFAPTLIPKSPFSEKNPRSPLKISLPKILSVSLPYFPLSFTENALMIIRKALWLNDIFDFSQDLF